MAQSINLSTTGANDGNGFTVTVTAVGTLDDTGYGSIAVKAYLNSTNNNFSQWTINSSITETTSGTSVTSNSVQRTLAKNSSLLVASGTYIQQSYTAAQTLKFKALIDGSGTASYIPDNATATLSVPLQAINTGSPATQNTAPTLSGSGLVGSALTVTPGTYSNGTIVSTTIAYNTSGVFSGTPVNTQPSGYTPTIIDANQPAYYYATCDYVTGTNNQPYYFYSSPIISKFQVAFNANGGDSTPSSILYVAGSTITLPGAISRTNYTFAGWNDGATTYAAGASYTPPSSSSSSNNLDPTTKTLTAQWTYTGGTTTYYSYLYNSNGGSNTPSSGSVVAGSAITLGSPGTYTGYTFTGWLSNATGQLYSAGATYYVNANNTVFTAQWSATGGGTTYPPTWSDVTLSQMVAGQTYSDGVSATNMNYSGSYSVSSGSLPAGLSLSSSTGAITGIVQSANDYAFTITATNSYGSIQQSFSGSIAGILKVYSNGTWNNKALARVYTNGEWKVGTVNVWDGQRWTYPL